MNGPSRRLRDDEVELWQGVTRSVAPLRPQRQAEPSNETRPPKPAAKLKPSPVVPDRPAAPLPPLPPLAPLGRRMLKRLARGSEEIDARLDLHGLTQAQAHAALLRFLRRAQADGAKNVLVITGKGRTGEGGVLKRQVPLWLRLPEFRALIVGFEDAHIAHGGEGALYVRLRRAKQNLRA